MSLLYRQIENSEIGLVAAQDVDRFFRDLTQIETNIFIDACRRNNVQVLTPSFVYDFAHPTQGRYHMQMFRDQAQRAADFIEYHVRGRLVKSRHWRAERGMWTGRKITPGFMVDMREKLPGGSPNPDWRKYRRFDLYADVVLAYFELFRANEGNLSKTWKQIEAEGPYLPDLTDDMVPAGFKTTDHLKRRSRITGMLTPSQSGFQQLLVNVAYIGHWIHQQVIVEWHNHEAIIPNDLFMYAYNRISQTDFYGEPNPRSTSPTAPGFVMTRQIVLKRRRPTPIFCTPMTWNTIPITGWQPSGTPKRRSISTSCMITAAPSRMSGTSGHSSWMTSWTRCCWNG